MNYFNLDEETLEKIRLLKINSENRLIEMAEVGKKLMEMMDEMDKYTIEKGVNSE